MSHPTFRHLIGVFFLFYAMAFYLRPDTLISRYIAVIFSTPPQVTALSFLMCGLCLVLLPVRPPYVVLLSFPLLLLALAGAARAWQDGGASGTGAIGHTLGLAGILRWAWARSKEGGNGGTAETHP